MGEMGPGSRGHDHRHTPAADSHEALLREQLLDRRRRLAAPGIAERPDAVALLREVDLALERFEQGTFGCCEKCHDQVEPERLAADPLTRVCLDCLTPAQAQALERDLALASVVQAALLPAPQLTLDGWEIEHHYRPLGAVSGDHCDVLRPSSPDEPLHFVLGDVAGKGVAASLLMSQLHAIFRSLVPLGLPLPKLMAHANRLLASSTLPGAYATVVLGRLDRDGGMEISNAGHVQPLLVRDGEVEPLRCAGLPLGLFPTGDFDVCRHVLRPGDLLLAYTDGLSEAFDADGEEYGAERICRVLGRASGAGPGDVLRLLMEDLGRFCGQTPLNDDLTTVAIRRAG